MATDLPVPARRDLPAALPSDVAVLSELGGTAWFERCWWPVSDAAFDAFVDACWRAFDGIYASLAGEERGLFLADQTFVVIAMQHAHARAVESGALRHGMALALGAKPLASFRPDWDAVGRAFDGTGHAPLHERVRLRLRSAAKALAINRRPTGDGASASLGSWSHLKAAHARRHGLRPAHLYAELIAAHRRPAVRRPALFDARRAFVAAIARAARETLQAELELPAMAEAAEARLAALAEVHAGAGAMRAAPRRLLLSELSRPLHRVVAQALRTRGTRVIGFQHGNDMGMHWRDHSSYIEYLGLDSFVTPTAASAEAYRARYARIPLSTLAPIAFESVGRSPYRDLAERERARSPVPASVRSVMIVAYHPTPDRHPHLPADYFVPQLDLELRVARLLRRAGLRVIYKAHPERAAEAAALFKDCVDAVETAPLQQSWHLGDALWFGVNTTTAFGLSLCTNRPIVLMNYASRLWNPAAYPLLARRCAMVPATVDDALRVDFDEEALLAAVRAKPAPPDDAFMEAFMIPQPGEA